MRDQDGAVSMEPKTRRKVLTAPIHLIPIQRQVHANFALDLPFILLFLLSAYAFEYQSAIHCEVFSNGTFSIHWYLFQKLSFNLV